VTAQNRIAWTAAAVMIDAPGGRVTSTPGTRRKNRYAVVRGSYICFITTKLMLIPEELHKIFHTSGNGLYLNMEYKQPLLAKVKQLAEFSNGVFKDTKLGTEIHTDRGVLGFHLHNGVYELHAAVMDDEGDWVIAGDVEGEVINMLLEVESEVLTMEKAKAAGRRTRRKRLRRSRKNTGNKQKEQISSCQ